MDEGMPVTFLDVSWDLTPAPVAEAPRDLVPAPSREQIVAFQERLAEFPQMELEPRHQFCDGMYVRTLAIPAGTIVVGKIHRHEHPVMLIKGRARINTDRGMETISAPHVWISQPGAKRALVALEDCEFTTVHLNPDNTRDLDAIEARVIEPEFVAGLLKHEAKSEFTDELQRMYA